MSLITPADYPTKGEYQTALEDTADACRHHAVLLAESLDFTSFEVPDFTDLERFLKMAESSVKKARKTIKYELQSRAANRARQRQKLQQEKQQHDD
jgi:hypothetical protein